MTSPRAKLRCFATPFRFHLASVGAVLALGLSPAAAWAASAAAARADQQFTSYAYAHEFGSGVYDFNGRTLQVYGLPFGLTFLERGEQNPGLRLRLPVTLGFLDFRTSDVIEIGLPDQVDSVSFVPGIEAEFAVGEHWRVLPYVQVGKSLASESDVETDLLGTGVRAERKFTAGHFDGLYAGEGIFSQVKYRGGGLPDDDFVRIRNGIELSRGTGRSLGANSIAYGMFAAVDAFVDPPSGPKTGIDVPRTQLELGIVFGTQPALRLWKVPLPRVGLSYRFAGDLSAARLVLGAPF